MTGRHIFSFEGGEQLTIIGATFFVSYLYYQHVDSTHMKITGDKNNRGHNT